MDADILNLEQACEFLNISAKTLIRILREEHIPARKIGREWRFSRRALIDWISQGDSVQYAGTQEDDYIAFRDTEHSMDDLLETISEQAAALRRTNDAASILPALPQEIPLPDEAHLYMNYKQKRGIEKIQFEIYWKLREELKLAGGSANPDQLPEHEKRGHRAPSTR